MSQIRYFTIHCKWAVRGIGNKMPQIKVIIIKRDNYSAISYVFQLKQWAVGISWTLISVIKTERLNSWTYYLVMPSGVIIQYYHLVVITH